MPKNSRTVRRDAHRAAVQARERRERRERQRRRMIWAAGSLGLILVAIIGLTIVKVSAVDQENTAPSGTLASDAVTRSVTAVPAAVLDQIGRGSVNTLPRPIVGQPALTSAGKPLVVYLGAEYCPFCAAQRWGVVVALARFGSFADLGATHSASADIYPDTATLSFHGATYASPYLVFEGVEMQSNSRAGSTYATLDTPSGAQRQLLRTYDAPPYVAADAAGSIPFIDFGNRYVASGASISPQLLAGLSAEQIAAALADPASPIAKGIDGSANVITAVLCQLTDQQPATVCGSPAAQAYVDKLT